MPKPKILILGADDTNQAGHAYHNYLNLPDTFEKRIVVQRANNVQNIGFALYYSHSLYWKFLRKFRRFCFLLEIFFRYQKIFHLENEDKGYEYLPIVKGDSAKTIIRKVGGFKPDIIYVKWIKGFLNYTTLRKLHELTGAHIVISFLDEEPMTGGCHYPVDCKGFMNKCENCPAVNVKDYSSFQLRKKEEALDGLPCTIIVSPFDASVTRQSTLFKNVNFIEVVGVPKVEKFTMIESREFFNLRPTDFVVLLGAQSINNPRKGFKYGIEALEMFCKDKSNVVILALGSISDSSLFSNINAKVLLPGFLSFTDMCKAYCASNCYLNPTIADSGPMMVNYAMSFGIPTISFKMGVANSLITNEKTGWLSDLYNIAGLINGLNYFYNTKDFQSIQKNCIETMAKYADQKPWYDRLLDNLYNFS